MAPLSHACRELLASPKPDDAEGRTYAQAIAQVLADKAIAGDIRAAQEIADRAVLGGARRFRSCSRTFPVRRRNREGGDYYSVGGLRLVTVFLFPRYG